MERIIASCGVCAKLEQQGELMYDVRDIANFTLDFADRRSLRVTNLALQKLLYFVHGWFYAIYEKPLIKNKFEAWKHGPVQRVIYDQFKVFKDGAIQGVRATYRPGPRAKSLVVPSAMVTRFAC